MKQRTGPARQAGPTLPSRAHELSFALLLLGDDLFLHAGRHLAVLSQFHRERSLPLRHAPDVGRVAERLGQRHFGQDVRHAVAHVGVDDHAAARNQVAGNWTLEMLRAFDLDLHDRFEEGGLGVLEVLAEATFRGRLERPVA